MTRDSAPPVASTSLWKLYIKLAMILLVAIGTGTFVIDRQLFALGDACASSQSPFPALSQYLNIGVPACAISIFFSASVATAGAKIMMSTFLVFVASLLTVMLVESERQNESPNAIVQRPAVPWLLVNFMTGSAVMPAIMAPASFHNTQEYLRAQERESRTALHAVPPANRVVHAESKLAIPISVTLGFVIPSMMLIFEPSPTTILLWQLFPLYIAILLWAGKRVITRSPLKPVVVPVLTPASRHCQSGETQRRAKVLLFAIPFCLSVMSYATALIYLLQFIWRIPRTEQAHASPFSYLTPPVIRLLAVNFSSMYVTAIYWIYVEGGILSAASALKCTLLAGPGAGLCSGWMVREAVIHRLVCEIYEDCTHQEDNSLGT